MNESKLAEMLEIAHRLIDDEGSDDYLALEESGALRLAAFVIEMHGKEKA
jgi:hypothetical protein